MKRPSLLLLLAIACTLGTEPTDSPRFASVVTPPKVLLIAGDIARCGIGEDEQTAALLDSLVRLHPSAIVVPNGDLVYETGTAANFANCYAPSWGRHRQRSRPLVGNHEYDASPTAQFYFDYWNGVGVTDGPAGPRGKGYYRYDPHPSWHVVALNTNSGFVSTRVNTPQGNWLKADLAAHNKPCLLALFHHPRFTSPPTSLSGYTLYPWQQLLQADADLAVNASFHHYERFAPQREDGTPDQAGIRQFIVGTGGASGAPKPATRRANSEKWGNTRGVLKLELGEGFYRWTFVSIPTRPFTDTGTASCHNAGRPIDDPPAPPPPDPTPPPVPPGTINLAVKGERRADGKAYMTLDWTGATGATVRVFRNGPLLGTTQNDGHYVNSKTYTGPATYTYKVCDAAGCSPEAKVSIP